MEDNSSRWFLFCGTAFLAILTLFAMALLVAIRAGAQDMWIVLFLTLAILVFNIARISAGKEGAMGLSRCLLWVAMGGYVAACALGILHVAGVIS